ncbi:hypothetical protein HHK36_023238 [Tetracentron sinense]|uniref:Uncharacterized protein n=1 Tax=Tetracentron sinense TaxID=13715 RepID=A0A834YQW5_TETSI|nr:hypothetical protein HHK36_023238 [Tetracentron sinense]
MDLGPQRYVESVVQLIEACLWNFNAGYLYNYQTKEFYDLSYAHERAEGSARFEDYFATKCGVLMMSLFVFFTTTMSVSFTLRETQARMLKFTGGIYHLSHFVLGDIACVRTPLSMKFFPRFFLLYFLVFHIYFFSYAYGFSYLAFSTTAAFMQHLILYFWNRFEVPALQRFLQNRRFQFQRHPDFQITSSTILASTLHITRLNMRNRGTVNSDPSTGPGVRTEQDQARPLNASGNEEPQETQNSDRVANALQFTAPPDLGQTDTGPNASMLNSFSSLLLWILGGASSEGLNSFLSMFRDVRDEAQVYAGSPQQETVAS